MINKEKFFVVVLLFILFFIVNSSASAADYNVNSNTDLDDIHNWINNTAQKGDRLIFTSSNYELNDTLVVNKPIIIGSRMNTVVNFNKNKTMVDIQTNAVNIIGLLLIHNKYAGYDNKNREFISTISTSTMKNSYIKFNMKNCKINTLNVGIDININGNIVNSKIKSSLSCISSLYWKGHLYNSELRGDTGIYFYDLDFNSLKTIKWKGNIVKSNIIVKEIPVSLGYYKGTVYNSRIYNNEFSTDGGYPAFGVTSGKFTINKSRIISIQQSPIIISKNKVKYKITKTKLESGKGYPKIDYYKFS